MLLCDMCFFKFMKIIFYKNFISFICTLLFIVKVKMFFQHVSTIKHTYWEKGLHEVLLKSMGLKIICPLAKVILEAKAS